MKENLFDVLIYLFENYMDSGDDAVPDLDVLTGELLEAGFHKPEINKAFDWLESLAGQDLAITELSASTTFRIFSQEEISRLDEECRGLLFFLEQAGILSASNREMVLDRLMALETEEISFEELKWVVLMVLFSQPDKDNAYARMEDFVYEEVPVYLH
jgi:Smg protein